MFTLWIPDDSGGQWGLDKNLTRLNRSRSGFDYLKTLK